SPAPLTGGGSGSKITETRPLDPPARAARPANRPLPPAAPPRIAAIPVLRASMSMTTEQPPPATPPAADLTQTPAAATGAGGPTALRPWQKTLLFSTPVLLVGLGWGAPVVVFRKYAPPAAAPEAERAAAEADGARLFAQHCAQCHGERGDGNGV